MNIDMFKLAIDDARTRHKAVVDLIFFTDNQAMNLLRLYVTLSLAAASAVVAIFGRESTNLTSVGYELLAAVFVFCCGSFECFRAMQSASINLPGRDPDFWLWIEGKEIDLVAKSYLEQLQDRADSNALHNQRSAKHLKHAKLAGIVAVPASLVAGLVSEYFLSDYFTFHLSVLAFS